MSACIIKFGQFARMFSVCGMKMIAARRWRSEGVSAASVLPDPAIISVYGLVSSTSFGTLET